MLDKEFAKIDAKGEEIEERRREVKENLAKVKMDKGKNVSNPTYKQKLRINRTLIQAKCKSKHIFSRKVFP